MLSLSKLSVAQASSYFKKDSYYQENSGEWQGRGADDLGLIGGIVHSDYHSVVNNVNPNTKEPLTRTYSDRTRVPGIDLTFSAPKGLSVLAAFDPELLEAHNQAVTDTLSYIEDNLLTTRDNTTPLREQVHTGSMIASKFTHSFSRELDPQLHTHCFISNATQLPNGKWQSLSMENFFSNTLFLGAAYRSNLANNLAIAGYEISYDDRGLFDLKGFDKSISDHFSTRSQQIAEKFSALKEEFPSISDTKLKQMAALDTRQPKPNISFSEIRSSWKDQLQDKFGLNPQQLIDSSHKKSTIISKIRSYFQKDYWVSPVDVIDKSAQLLTTNESTFSKKDILVASMKMAPQFSIGTLSHALDQQMQNSQILFAHDSSDRLTTPEIHKAERNVIDSLRRGQNKSFSFASLDNAISFMDQSSLKLTQGQESMVTSILSTKDQFFAIQGDAGTGKTTALQVVKQFVDDKQSVIKQLGQGNLGGATKAFFSKNRTIRGMAFTGKAANEIFEGSGIESTTIDSFLNSIKRAQSGYSKDTSILEKGQTWIVDESSMLGSKQFSSLVDVAKSLDSKIIFIGDTKQLPSISAGKLFETAMKDKAINFVEMNEVMRQTESWYKTATEQFKSGDINSAFKTLSENNSIQQSTVADLQPKVVDWFLSNDYKNSLVVTPLNKDREALNLTIRSSLQNRGDISTKDHNFNISLPVSTDTHSSYLANSYSEGNTVVQMRSDTNLKQFQQYDVIGMGANNNILVVKDPKTGKNLDINLLDHGSTLNQQTTKQQSFSEGEKIVFLKNDKFLNVQNGTTGFITDIKKDQISVSFPDSKRNDITFSAKSYNSFTHGWAVTDYKSQGYTANKVAVMYPSNYAKGMSFQSVYVALTRGRSDIKVFTDNVDKLISASKSAVMKTSTVTKDYLSSLKSDNLRVDTKSKSDTQSKSESITPSRTYSVISSARNFIKQSHRKYLGPRNSSTKPTPKNQIQSQQNNYSFLEKASRSSSISDTLSDLAKKTSIHLSDVIQRLQRRNVQLRQEKRERLSQIALDKLPRFAINKEQTTQKTLAKGRGK